MSADPKWRVVSVPVGPEDRRDRVVRFEGSLIGATDAYESYRQSGEDLGGLLLLDPEDSVIYACS